MGNCRAWRSCTRVSLEHEPLARKRLGDLLEQDIKIQVAPLARLDSEAREWGRERQREKESGPSLSVRDNQNECPPAAGQEIKTSQNCSIGFRFVASEPPVSLSCSLAR